MRFVRGDVHELPALRGARGHEQQGRRYVVILQSDDLPLSTMVVAPTSTNARAATFRPEIDVLGLRTLVLVEQATTVDAGRLTQPAAVRNVRPWGGEPVDLHLEHGRIAAIGAVAPREQWADTDLDGRGLLALPSIVNTHAHVDKSWWGLPWQSWGGEPGTDGRIRHERARRDELGSPASTSRPACSPRWSGAAPP